MNYWKLRWALERRERLILTAHAEFNDVMRAAGLDPAKKYDFNDVAETVTEKVDEPKAGT